MGGLVSDRHLIQAIRRPAPEILARSRYRAERPSGACGPGDAGLGGAPGWLSGSETDRAWGWVTSRWRWPLALAWRPRLLARKITGIG